VKRFAFETKNLAFRESDCLFNVGSCSLIKSISNKRQSNLLEQTVRFPKGQAFCIDANFFVIHFYFDIYLEFQSLKTDGLVVVVAANFCTLP